METKQANVFRIFSTAFLFLVFSSCSSLSVQTSADPQADLAKYKTFAWASDRADGAESAPTSITEQTMRASVEEELAAKGLKPAMGAQPDLLIASLGGSRNEVTHFATPDFGYPNYPYYGNAYVTRKGSLTLQFIDASSKRIVWQGTASDAISDAGPNQEQVRVAVRELLEKYPAA
jgi:hypothetical protein